MGFPAKANVDRAVELLEFQSLIGIYGFSGGKLTRSRNGRTVSIPNRDLWVFRPDFTAIGGAGITVSIPNRDLWVFRLVLKNTAMLVQSFNP